MNLIRQGDVLLVPVDAVPATANTTVARDGRGRLILAEGEVTGHTHAIIDESAELVTSEEAPELYLLVHGTDPVALLHEEHATVHVPPGKYERRILREYQPDAIRNVAD
jgi:hypothetical protein